MLLRLNKDNQVCVHTFEWAANSIERMYITWIRKRFRTIIGLRNILGKDRVLQTKNSLKCLKRHVMEKQLRDNCETWCLISMCPTR